MASKTDVVLATESRSGRPIKESCGGGSEQLVTRNQVGEFVAPKTLTY